MAAKLIATPEMTASVYGELRRLAALYLRDQRKNHTLQPTALVHEAYVKMVQWNSAPWRDRAHFIGVAALLMRQVLVLHARKRAALKRTGGQLQVVNCDQPGLVSGRMLDVLVLDRALTELEEHSAQACRIVELRFFGGLSIAEIADYLKISPATVKRNWSFGKTWLRRQIEDASWQ